MPHEMTTVPGTVLQDGVIPARGNWAAEMRPGQVIRIEDIEGQQAVDLICYNRQKLAEKFWAAHTAKLNGTIYITQGHVLFSDLANPMMTIVEDTVGVNDVICGSCSLPLDRLRYGPDNAQPGCMENFEVAIAPWGLCASTSSSTTRSRTADMSRSTRKPLRSRVTTSTCAPRWI
jgi:uncharacterized protein YcgI (DUF1989 family)